MTSNFQKPYQRRHQRIDTLRVLLVGQRACRLLWSPRCYLAPGAVRARRFPLIIGCKRLLITLALAVASVGFLPTFDGKPNSHPFGVFTPSPAVAAELDATALDALSKAIAMCWTVPEDADRGSLRFQLASTGELSADPLADVPSDGSGLSFRETNGTFSGYHAIKDCAPYADVVAMEPKVVGVSLRLHVDPTAPALVVELASMTSEPSTKQAATPGDNDHYDATDAIALVLEVERNEAASMQKRSTPHLYRFVPTRTLFENGVVYLEQQVGANNVVYATIYCAFNDTDVDASRIRVGVEAVYSRFCMT